MGALGTLFVAGVFSDLQAVSYYVDPSSGSMANNGSSGSPWSTLEAVFSSGKIFQGGDIIYLRNGYHGFPVISGNNSGTVTIQPQSGHSPTMKKLSFFNASRWVVSDVTISPQVIGQYDTTGSLVYIESNCNLITLQDSHIYNTTTVSGWTAAQVASRTGIAVRCRAPNSQILNNHIQNTKYAVMVEAPAVNAVCSYNLIEGVVGDGVRCLANYGTYEYNIVKDFYGVDSHHDDGFQSWSGGHSGIPVGGTTVYGLVLRGNTIIDRTSASLPFVTTYGMQGIGFFDGYFQDCVFENNLIVTDMYHGLTLYGARNCRVVNNTVVRNSIYTYNRTPWIKVRAHKNGGSAYGNLVRNNLTSIMANEGSIGTVDNNIVSTSYTSHFVDYSGFDFHLKSSSSAVNAGSTSQAPSTDLDRNARTSPYDVGAYEYGASSSDDTAPTAPSNLVATSVSTQSVDLTWDASTDEVGVTAYTIFANGSSVATVDDAVTAVTLTGLAHDTSYAIKVRAYDAASNESGDSNIVNLTTLEEEYPTISAVTANEDDGNVPANTIDNNLSTRWSAEGDGDWIRWDLGGTYTVTTVDIGFYNGNSRSYDFDLEVSTDGSGWTQVFSGESSGTTLNQETFSVIPTQGRYVRYVGYGNSYNDWNSLTEADIGVLVDDTPDTTAPSTPTGLTLVDECCSSVTLSWTASTDDVAVVGYKVYTDGSNPLTVTELTATITGLEPDTTYTFTVSAFDEAQNESSQSSELNVTTEEDHTPAFVTVTASEDDGNDPLNVIDGDLDTRWSAEGDPEWLLFELDEVYTLESIDIAFYKGDERVAYFEIEVSIDGSNWTTVLSSGASSGSSLSLQNFDTTDALAKYVRYVGSGNSGNLWNSVTEVELELSEASLINKIQNPEFNNATANWTVGNYGGTATISVASGEGLSGDNSMEIGITGAGTNIWDIQVYQDVTIANGSSYSISFQAKADASRTMKVVVQNTESPYQEYWSQTVNLTTSVQTFGPYTYNSSTTDATARFKFFVAGSTTDIFVDAVEMSE